MGNEQSSGANIDDLRQHNVPIKLPPAKPGKNSSFLKGSSDPSHFIVEINVGKSRIRH